MPTNDTTPARSSGTPAAILAATAFLLGALVVIKAGDLPANEAYAGTAAGGGGISIATASNGVGKDTRPNEQLYVVDNRSEVLFIYEIEDVANRRIVPREIVSLPEFFRRGRGR